MEISNLMRTVYLILSIPCWGYSAGINTLVSNFIGNKKRQAVLPLIYKTTKLNLLSTMLISMPVVLFPEFFLYPLFGKEDMTLILLAKPYMPMLLDSYDFWSRWYFHQWSDRHRPYSNSP